MNTDTLTVMSLRKYAGGIHSLMPSEGTIFVSDKLARLKPCWRCGYSLAKIPDAKNCPECGLAVRISLSSNNSLEWTNPSWQRFMSFAFAVLAIGLFCKPVGAASYWILRAVNHDRYHVSDQMYLIFELVYRYSDAVCATICGLALCMLAKGERRHPDVTRGARAVCFGAGCIVVVLGVLAFAVGLAAPKVFPRWGRYALSSSVSGPWIPLIISLLCCFYAFVIGKRGHSRLLSKVSELPYWPAVAGLVVWLFNGQRVFWALPAIILDLLFPLSMIVVACVTILVLQRGAREADANWVTDP